MSNAGNLAHNHFTEGLLDYDIKYKTIKYHFTEIIKA